VVAHRLLATALLAPVPSVFTSAQATTENHPPKGLGRFGFSKIGWESGVLPGHTNNLGDCVHCRKEKLLRDSQRQSPVLAVLPYQPTNTSDWYFSMISRRTGQ